MTICGAWLEMASIPLDTPDVDGWLVCLERISLGDLNFRAAFDAGLKTSVVEAFNFAKTKDLEYSSRFCKPDIVGPAAAASGLCVV